VRSIIECIPKTCWKHSMLDSNLHQQSFDHFSFFLMKWLESYDILMLLLNLLWPFLQDGQAHLWLHLRKYVRHQIAFQQPQQIAHGPVRGAPSQSGYAEQSYGQADWLAPSYTASSALSWPPCHPSHRRNQHVLPLHHLLYYLKSFYYY